MTKKILMVGWPAFQQELFAETLSRAGFDVHANDSYEYPPDPRNAYDRSPDLVLLCCEKIAEEEQVFIGKVLAGDSFVIVLSSALPLNGACFLLLANPDNLNGVSLDPHSLIDLVEEAFLSMYGKSAIRESHHLGSSLGLIRLYVDNIRQILKGEQIASTDLERELDKVVNDVRRVLSRSRAFKMRDRESEALGEVESRQTLPATALLEYSKWALPLPPTHIKLTVEHEKDLASVAVVPGQVIEILRSLVENSIEAMIELSSGEITIKAFNDDTHVQIEVKDSGPGITEEHKSKIFNMFFSTKEVPEAGFGLYEARKFALNNDGELFLTSQLGQGSTFILRLPKVGEGQTYDREYG